MSKIYQDRNGRFKRILNLKRNFSSWLCVCPHWSFFVRKEVFVLKFFVLWPKRGPNSGPPSGRHYLGGTNFSDGCTPVRCTQRELDFLFLSGWNEYDYTDNFLFIMKRKKFRLVHNQEEKSHYDNTPFNSKVIRNLFQKALTWLYIEFVDSTGLYYIMFAHNSVVLREKKHYYVQP